MKGESKEAYHDFCRSLQNIRSTEERYKETLDVRYNPTRQQWVARVLNQLPGYEKYYFFVEYNPFLVQMANNSHNPEFRTLDYADSVEEAAAMVAKLEKEDRYDHIFRIYDVQKKSVARNVRVPEPPTKVVYNIFSPTMIPTTTDRPLILVRTETELFFATNIRWSDSGDYHWVRPDQSTTPARYGDLWAYIDQRV